MSISWLLENCFELANDTLIVSIQKIESLTSELLKGSELVLDSAMKLCKVYAQMVDWDLSDLITHKESSDMDRGEADLHLVAKISKCTIEKLSELSLIHI